ncbi:MAG: hypothetical protein ACLGSA_05215 [Acidobacteriota bacterium]
MVLAAALAATATGYLLAYGDALWMPGHIAQNWDQSFPPFPDEVRTYGSISGSTWSSLFELGSPSTMNGLTFYFDLLVRNGLSFLGGGILARWLNLAYMLLGAAGFCALSRRLGLSGFSTLAVCAISQFNPRTYSLALSGHTEAGFAYALAPWLVALADTAIKTPSRRHFLAAGLGTGVVLALACSSPFGVTSAGLLLALYCASAMAGSPRSPWRALGVLALAGAVMLVLHLHWILPTALGSAGSSGIKHNQTVQEIQADYIHKYREYSIPPRQAMIGHTDNLGMGSEYAYPVASPVDQWWKPSAFALLAFALLGLLGRTTNPVLKWFAALCLLLGFVLLTGAWTLPGRYLYEVVLYQAKVLFFFMARPTRWLLVYFTGFALLAGLGMEAVFRRTIWRAHRWPDRLAVAFATTALAVYLFPWWSGQLAVPKNETTQTMAITPQPLRPEERTLAEALGRDPGIYRVTVFPTISSPTGDIPAPPSSSLTRNFAMMGKDSLVGPAFIGNPYGRYLLSVAHRRVPFTDEYGRLLGLGAVRRVIWDKDEPYLSYLDFGWMPPTRRGSETLPDPRDVLRPFLQVQRDLPPDKGWSFGPFVTLDNADFLPRVRVAQSAALAAGGFPLLSSMAQLQDNPFERTALFFSTDLDTSGIDRLGTALHGVMVHNDSWPELLLPYLAPASWRPALQAGQAVPDGWERVSDRWHQTLWFEGSPLNAGSLLARTSATLTVPLSGNGPHRLLTRVGSVPAQHGLTVSLGGTTLAQTSSADPFDKGWLWLDLGTRVLDGSPMTIQARGRGAVVSGVLAVPENEFAAARTALENSFPAGSDTVLAEAEACAQQSSGVYSAIRDIALLAPVPGMDMQTENLRTENQDGSGAGTLAAEGDQPGQATFRMDFPYPVSGFTLTSYPRLFGDPEGKAYVRASWSTDGQSYLPLYELTAATDGKWEDVYARRKDVSVRQTMTSVWIRFDLRQAQLVSLVNQPNHPMTITAAPAHPFPGAASMGQAVMLPARFMMRAPAPGPHRARARLLTPQGPLWQELGVIEPGPQGMVELKVDTPGDAAACDLLELRGQTQAGTPGPMPALDAARLSAARYSVQGELPGHGVLLFSEAYHPAWLAKSDKEAIKPLRAYGFMNAYPLPEAPPQAVLLEFSAERFRDLGLAISIAGWGAFALLIAALLCWPRREIPPPS